MLICCDCGQAFETPVNELDPHPELDGCPQEIRCICPFCSSADLSPARSCDRCGAWYPVSAVPPYGLCRKCLNDADTRFKRLLAKNFTAGEIEFLNDYYDGDYFGGPEHAGKETGV